MVEIETVQEDEDAAEKARAEAEARRQKIMQEAEDRMGVVEGRHRELDESKEEEAPAEATSKPKSSGAARMAAMRKRRFRKKEAAPTTGKSKEKADDDKEADKAGPQKHEEPQPELAESADKEASAPEKHETKKKYVGVAKMRRKKLKQQAAEKAEVQPEARAAASVTVSPSLKRKKGSVLPILFHALVTFLLFMTGFDVGWQQRNLSYGSDLMVDTMIAPRSQKLRFLSVLGINLSPVKEEEEPKTTLLSDQGAGEEWVEQDEFSDTLEEGKGEVRNVDPLFRVDLDKLTQGTGLYWTAARFAVSVHRLNLHIFYYGPQTFFRRLTDFGSHLVESPPVLCLTALVLRQVVAKMMLGVHKLPVDLDDPSEHKDVVSVIKQFVTKFLAHTFPTAVGLYDGYVHLRADMYVVLCGLFVGLALSHTLPRDAVVESLSIDLDKVDAEVSAVKKNAKEEPGAVDEEDSETKPIAEEKEADSEEARVATDEL